LDVSVQNLEVMQYAYKKTEAKMNILVLLQNNTLCPEKVTPRQRTIKMSNLNESG